VSFAAIVTAGTLQEYIEPVAALVDECKIHLAPDSLSIRAVDPANVAMVEARLDADACESYEADGGTIGINLDRFEDVIGFGDSGDLVHLKLDEATRTLDVAVGSLDYTFALIDPEAIRQEPDLPELDLPAEVVVEGAQLDDMATAADMVSDHVTFGVDTSRDEFFADAQGDTDDACVAYDRDDCIDLVTGTAYSLYSLDYVTDIVGAMPDEAEIRVALGESQPATFNYDLAEGRASVSTMLSPRIQTDGGSDDA